MSSWNMKVLLLGLSFPLLLVSPSKADVLELLNGARISGKWVNPSSERPATFEFETEDGAVLSFESRQVKRVVALSENEKEYLKLPRPAEDIPAQEAAVQWCEAHNQKSLANAQRERILDIDANHKSARDNLNYRKTSNGWVREDRFMSNLGMIKVEGKWRFPEDVAIENASKAEDVEVAKSKNEFSRNWKAATTGGTNAEQAVVYLNQVKDPKVTGFIRELLFGKTPTASNLRPTLIEILGRIQSFASVAVLGEVAIKDAEQKNRQQAIELLKKFGSSDAISSYVIRLRLFKPKEDTPEIVNRLAYAINELSDNRDAMPHVRRAIPVLIERLITDHQAAVSGGGANSAGITSEGGMNFGQGNKGGIVSQQSQNREVLGALRTVSGQDFGFNKPAWNDWYANNFAKTHLVLRRDP